MLEADGNIWELNAPYGGHMGAVCLSYGSIWELCVSCMGAILHHTGAKMVPTVRQTCKLYVLYGAIWAVWELLVLYWSHMEALWAIREVDGTIWESNAPYRGHMGAICTAQEVDGLWEPCGAIWETDGIIWEAKEAIWEQCAQYGAHMVVVSLCGSRVHCKGAVCTIWVPCMPYGSHMVHNGRQCHTGAAGVLWEPYGSRVGRIGDGWHHMGPVGTVWGPSAPSEMDGTIWDLLALYGGHMGSVCTKQ
jgi:hypothetical protein